MVGRLAAIAPPVVVRKEDAASVRGGGGSTRAGRAGWAGDSNLQCLRCAVIAGCRRARQGVLVVVAEVPGLGAGVGRLAALGALRGFTKEASVGGDARAWWSAGGERGGALAGGMQTGRRGSAGCDELER